MFNPLSLFSTLKSGVITVAVVAGLTLVGSLWVQKNLAEKRIESLQIEKVNLQNTVIAREVEVKGLKIAIESLEDTFRRIDEHRGVEEEISREIENAPSENDGPVAPVLRDAIRSVERLYNPNKN
ncbi:hypothetical protein KEU06_09705 [Pseudaminobacter sp. 19-2017]|uniref:Uncharacterized protein n=1 Tax=Pseudaminobacter soli (ex Zhang et al. 2022) TaxID=2831468 RepID=A0A942E0R6_9HYPH|nr:hypothetical protein [Pseudaminobacter soli]MBS3648881.1 hypothetical protein [Pseudaminobacter soli]